MEPDFTGYATRSGLKCTDGRVIMAHAFSGNDGQTVPLVWQHQHSAPDNVLGYAMLHSSEEGVRAEGFFNETPAGLLAKMLVRHGDIKNLSIYANQLVQQAMNVVHGVIREVSLVLSGANPGAFIDNVNLAHGDGTITLDDEAIIYTDQEISLGKELVQAGIPATTSALAIPAQSQPAVQAQPPPLKPSLAAIAGALTHAADLGVALPAAQSPDLAVADIAESFSPEQVQFVYALVGAAMEKARASMQQSAIQEPPASTDQDGAASNDQRGDQVTRNVFDQTDTSDANGSGTVLTHADTAAIFAEARKGGSLKHAVEGFALTHGITNIDMLFPDARPVDGAAPDWMSRRQEWVQGVLTATRHTPFSRIKTMLADITLDEARARGYVKGAMKREEWFAVSRRITTPQTVYKRQKLDRDDILDITEFDVVVWVKNEMRLALDEEIARAILIGDGRDIADPDKISESNVRPVLTDNDVYVTTVNVASTDLPPTASKTYEAIVDAVATAMQFYQGTGMPVFYAPRSWITKVLLTKDTLGRRLHSSLTELADAMGVRTIVPVDVMEAIKATVVGVIVNLADYSVGTDRGGEVTFFEDFDIDYNKETYLFETRMSGALTKFKSALVVKLFTGTSINDPHPMAPTFVKSTGVVTVTDHTADHYTYVTVNDTTGVETAVTVYGAQTAIGAGTQVHYRAKAASGYAFSNDASANWTFQRPAA